MMTTQKKKVKNFRKRSIEEEDVDDRNPNKLHKEDDEEEEERRLVLEEVKLLQKQRERKSGIPAFPTTSSSLSSSALNSAGAAVNGVSNKVNSNGDKNNDADGGGGGGEKEELVLQDTFAIETAVLVEDPNMVRYVEQELAKKRGKSINATDQIENDVMRADDELYKIPEHLKVKERNSEESSTQWTTGIAEIQLPIEFKLRNIEETEAAKKLLQDRRLAGRTKTESSIPSSYSADYFQRGRDYAEKLRKENPEVYKAKDTTNDGAVGPKEAATTTTDAAKRRETATDQIMLERFRKRERHRVMRR